MNTQIAKLEGDILEDLSYGVLVDDEGKQLIPTVATLSVKDGDSVISVGGGSFDITNGVASYDWSTAEESAIIGLGLPKLNLRGLWTFTVGADTHERVQFFDVVPVRIRTRVTDNVLRRHYGYIDQRRDRLIGTATGGSVNTLIDTDTLHQYETSAFEGSVLEITSGINAGNERVIASYDPDNAELTVVRDFDDVMSSDETYEILLSYNPLIQEAWIQIQTRVIDWFSRQDQARLVDGNDFTEEHRNLSLALVCEAIGQGDFFDESAQKFRMAYEAAMTISKNKFDNKTEADGLLRTNHESFVNELSVHRYWGK